MKDIQGGRTLIGEGKRFKDRIAYISAVFQDFNIDYQYDPVLLTEFGHEQLNGWASYWGIMKHAEKVKENYISNGWR